MIKTAVIGVGNMGSRYATILQDSLVEGISLGALTRLRSPYKEKLATSLEAGVPVFESADELFENVENNSLDIDAVIIATPHISHESIAVRAFKNGLHVLCDKPSGIFSRQGRLMEESAKRSGKVFGMVFNQRTSPMYIKLKEIVDSKKYGELKRVNWVVTDWYRPEQYYSSSSWHATWATDGGGVLLNQCPHNLDLLQWICGMPQNVMGFCHEGHFHNIEVEDDVTAYFEWPNGATGTFITSTGDAPGINRLEISLDEALIVCENGKLKIGELEPEIGMSEAQYRATSTDFFKKLNGSWKEITTANEPHPYEKIIQGFADECNGLGTCVVSGYEGRKSLLLSNAIYLSSWKKKMIELPTINSISENDFESSFEKEFETKKDQTC